MARWVEPDKRAARGTARSHGQVEIQDVEGLDGEHGNTVAEWIPVLCAPVGFPHVVLEKGAGERHGWRRTATTPMRSIALDLHLQQQILFVFISPSANKICFLQYSIYFH